MSDLISRQDAKSKKVYSRERHEYVVPVAELDWLPSAQPDGIPLEWIDKHLEWFDNCDNDFAQLAKVSIRAMVEIWKKDKT